LIDWLSQAISVTSLKGKNGGVYKHFENFASLDLHLEEIKKSQRYHPEDIEVTSQDCMNLLIATKSLIKYVGSRNLLTSGLPKRFT
jgi:hypothetical protein